METTALDNMETTALDNMETTVVDNIETTVVNNIETTVSDDIIDIGTTDSETDNNVYMIHIHAHYYFFLCIGLIWAYTCKMSSDVPHCFVEYMNLIIYTISFAALSEGAYHIFSESIMVYVVLIVFVINCTIY